MPQLRDDDWDLPAACAKIEDITAIPARRWYALASAVVDALSQDLVWRHPPPTIDLLQSPGPD